VLSLVVLSNFSSKVKTLKMLVCLANNHHGIVSLLLSGRAPSTIGLETEI